MSRLGGKFCLSEKYAGGISDCSVTMVIVAVIIPADLGDEKTVGLHGGAGFFRETAMIRIGAAFADPAAAGA